MDSALKLAFVLSATDKMSRVIDEAVNKSTNKLSSFERTTGKVGSSMMKGGAMLMGAGVAVGAAVIGVGKSMGDYAGSVKDMSEATGIGADSWQKMTYAAKISGIEQEKLMGSMVKFDKLLADAAGGSKSASQLFKDLGISIKDAGGKMRAPEAIFEDVAGIFAKVEDGAEKTALACAFFGKSGAELMPMLNEGKAGLQGLYKTAEETGNVMSGDALLAADEFGKKLDAIGLQAKGMMLQIGSSLMPILSTFQQNVSDIIAKVSNWIKANPELASTIGRIAAIGGVLLIGLGALSAVMGALTFAVGKLGAIFRGTMAVFKAGKAVIGGVKAAMGFAQVAISGMRGTTVAANSATRAYMVSQGVATAKTKAYAIGQKLAAVGQWVFNSSLLACPLTWIVLGIAAVVAAVVGMVKYWDEISAFFAKLWDGIKNVFSAAWEWIKNIFLNYTPYGLIIKHWDSIKAWFSKLWEGVKNVFSATWDWIKKMFFNYTPHGLVIKHWDAIGGWFSGLWDGVKNIFSAVWEWIKNMFLNYTPHGLIIKHWDAIGGWFSGLWDGVKNIFIGAWDGIGNFFASLNPVEWLGTMWAGVSSFFSDLWKKFYNWGGEIINGLIDGVVGMAKKAVDSVKNVGSKISEGFKSFFGINSPSKLFAEYGVNITQGLTGGIDESSKSVQGATAGMAEQVNSGFTQSLKSNSVDASSVMNSVGGSSVNYNPNITINGNAGPEVLQDFEKMLRSHQDVITNIVSRAAENRTRLSFNS